MATITINQYNDDGTTSRTAGEVLTINGATFTIRTDTRWHNTAPASMTGTMGGNSIISATLGGGLVIDSRNVRWLAYDTGSGNVPAIGTSITQGGVSASYLLGVWADLTSAPTAVGAAMPTSGFLKFREVTGTFASGALTGIGASATGPDVQGWMEIVADQLANFNIPRLGNFTVRGGWFELGTTTGAAQQVVQTPTNGGGANTFSPGLWIEEVNQSISGATWSGGVATFTTSAAHPMITGQGAVVEGVTPAGYNTEQKVTVIDSTHFSMPMTSDPGTYSSGGSLLQFEFYPALRTTTQFATANLGTDIRSRFVENMGSGQCRIGGDGTNAIGYVPGSGKRIRMPSNIFRQCTTGARATNAAPHATIATRPDFTTTSAGAIDIEFFYGDWYALFAQPYSVKLWHFANFDSVNISECATALDLWDGITGMYGGLDINSLLLTSNFAGGTITEWGGPRGNAAGSNDHDISIQYCIGQTFEHCRGGILAFARSSGVPIYANQCSDLTFNECRTTNGPITLNTSFNCAVNNKDHVDRYVGATTTATGYSVVISNSCDGIMVDGHTFGIKGTIANCHPYTGVVSCLASSNVKIRNFGTRSAFLDGGSANNPGYIFVDGGNNVNVAVQRCYMTPTRTGAHSSLNSSKNMLFEDVYGDFADSLIAAGLNMRIRGGGGTNTVTGQASVYGTHWHGAFTSDTVGRIWLALNEPTAETLQYTSRLFSAGSGFTSAGGLSLATLGDYFICEMQVFKKQHTSFQNAAATLTGTNTANHSYEYQIDTGSGWNGSWKTLNGTNLSGETIDPGDGFKLKLKIECTTAAATNLISYVRILTNSTLADQVNNLYPLDPVDAVFSMSGLEAGTEIILFNSANTELDREVLAGTDYSYPYTWTGTDSTGNYALIWKGDKVPIKFTGISFTDTSVNVPISQIEDLVYNGTYTPQTLFDFAAMEHDMNTGVSSGGEVTLPIPQIYSEWKDEIRLTNNAQYDFFYTVVGGQTIATPKSIPKYVYQANGSKLNLEQINHTLILSEGVLVPESGKPYVAVGSYNRDVIYESPVQAIVVSTGGTVAPTAAEMRSAVGLGAANLDTQLSAIQVDTDDIQTRLPTALVGGRMDASVGAVENDTITAASIAADAATEIAAEVLAAAQTTPIHSDVRKVYNIAIDGAGTEVDPWGPA